MDREELRQQHADHIFLAKIGVALALIVGLAWCLYVTILDVTK